MQKSNDNADSTLWLKMRETAESMMRAGKPAAEARDALVEIMQAHLGQPNSPPCLSPSDDTKTNPLQSTIATATKLTQRKLLNGDRLNAASHKERRPGEA